MNRQKRGTVLIITLGILTIMAVMGSSFAVLMRTEYEATQNYMLAQRANLIAKDGVVAAGKNLQDLLTYSYYSSLYNDDPDMPEYLKLWCYGVDKSTGNYLTKMPDFEYEEFGGQSIMDNLAPVSLPYPYVDTMQKKTYIDFNGDGEFKKEDNDVLLEEYDTDPDNRIFYDETEERPLFSGFPADGRFIGDVDIVAGQTFTGGNRYKLKIFETNSQLSMNYLSTTLYDFLVSADPQTKDCEGSQFKYMLYFLGQGIQKMLASRIRAETKAEPVNPFNKDVVDALWKLRTSYGNTYEVQQFSSKTQIRSIVEDPTIGNPGYWKYVRDFITISAWPGYNSLYAQYNANTIVPTITDANSYKEKLGEYDDSDPTASSTPGKITTVNKVFSRVQPPVDCNTATIPVLYSAIAFISGDARFWYFSPDKGNTNEGLYASDPSVGTDATAFILESELARARRMWASNEKSLATKGTPGAVDSKNYHYKAWNLISQYEKEVKQYDQFDFIYGEANGTTLFKRNYQVLQYLNISPFRSVWDFNDVGSGTDYAFNFARAIDSLRPFTGWADFDKRVIQDIIIDSKGTYNIPGAGQVQICEQFNSYWHPWNTNGPGGDPDCDINQNYFEQWYYEAVADLVRANFNPTPKITKWNPDATYYQKIDRSDLVYWTVPFIFQNPGIFEVTSVGEIIGQVFDAEASDYIPKPVIQKQHQAIIKVADIVRHHSQRDFVTGFPAHEGDFDDEDPDDYSVVRLMAHEDDSEDFRRYSRVTTYPQPINEDTEFLHIKDHERIQRGAAPPDSGDHKWERTYYTGNYSASGPNNSTELLYGCTIPNIQVPVGYVTVRPQDTGPFDYEMRTDPNAGYAYMGTPNNIRTLNYSPINTNGAAALEISTKNDNDRENEAWLNFWMPFNETYNTISKHSGSSVYGFVSSGGQSFQSARIGSEENNSRPSGGTYNIISSLGLIWNASGYTFRSYDYERSISSGTDLKDSFPTYLEYPSGVGFSTTGIDSDLNQRNNLIESEDIIEIMPHEDIQKAVTEMEYEDSDEYQAKDGAEGTHRQHQWQRQKQTNFPYYQGTVEFWFKSDIDQWDMTAEGYDADEDTFYGGFLSANVLVQADEDDGIQGCQTYFLREMRNVLRVTRVYFIDAIKGSVNGTTMDHWVYDHNEGDAGEGHAVSSYIYNKGDTVPDLMGLDQNTGNDFTDLDTEDLGFIFARYDSWIDLTDLEAEGFKWRPHEWYHLAFSFKSNYDIARHPERAINFFINGVYVDQNLFDNFPTTKMANDTSLWNTGTLLQETFHDVTKESEQIPQKFGSIVNEVIERNDHGARLVIGAIKRNQATDDQIEDWNSNSWQEEETIHKEMFYFADGPFVSPCNGTIDSVRITGRYLDVGDNSFLNGTRIRAFARYNTSPGEPMPDKLGSYQNGFRNSWGRDIRIANINWNEYRPKWDSSISEEVYFDDSSYCELSFWSFEELKFDKIDAYRSYGFNSALSKKYKTPFKAEIGSSPNGLSTEGVVDMGVAFPKDPTNLIGDDIEKFVVPADGCFIYEVGFYQGGLSAANAAAIFDELTVTILTPVEIFSFEEISE